MYPLLSEALPLIFNFVIPDKWSPALQIRTVLLSIQALLSAPNPDDPLANDVAEQWKLNESQAIETGNFDILKLKSIPRQSRYVLMFLWTLQPLWPRFLHVILSKLQTG